MQQAPIQYLNPVKSRVIQRIKNYTTGVDQYFANPEQPSLSPPTRNNHFNRQVYQVIPRNYSPNVRFSPPSHFGFFKPVQSSYTNTEIPVHMHKRSNEILQPSPSMANPNVPVGTHSTFYPTPTFQANMKSPLGYSGQPRYYGGPAQGVFRPNTDFMMANPQNSEIYRSKSSTTRSRKNLPENCRFKKMSNSSAIGVAYFARILHIEGYNARNRNRGRHQQGKRERSREGCFAHHEAEVEEVGAG